LTFNRVFSRDAEHRTIQGRLVVERPDLVLIASGDRRDELDASALATILASLP